MLGCGCVCREVLQEVFGASAWEDVAARYCVEYEPGKFRCDPRVMTTVPVAGVS